MGKKIYKITHIPDEAVYFSDVRKIAEDFCNSDEVSEVISVQYIRANSDCWKYVAVVTYVDNNIESIEKN